MGSDKLSSELHVINEAANRDYTHLELDYHFNIPGEPEHIYYRSDHYNFARRKIPVIFYTTGEHADYHRATDDVEKIQFDRLAERARLVFHTAWVLANREARSWWTPTNHSEFSHRGQESRKRSFTEPFLWKRDELTGRILGSCFLGSHRT